MPIQLWTPEDLLNLPPNSSLYLGLLRDHAHTSSMARARRYFENPRLLITIERLPGKHFTLSSDFAGKDVKTPWEPGDSCYPILFEEWEYFIALEAEYCRLPIKLYAVEAAEYTASF